MEIFIILLLAVVGSIDATTFGCAANGVTDSNRQYFLDFHNGGRRSVAKGAERNKCGKLPSGKNIFELNYDCDLEQVAYTWASNCSGRGYSIPGYTALLFAGTMGSASFNLTKIAHEQIEGWWGTLRENGMPTNLAYIDGTIEPWEIMVYGNTTAFGCAYFECYDPNESLWKYKPAFGCVYNNKPARSYPIYEKGPACTTATDCTVMPGSTCNDGLCHTDNKTTIPFILPNTICPNIIAEMHNDDMRNRFVNRHNELKSLGARGLAPDPMGTGGYAPKAKQSLKYIWDCDIEANALAWSQNCVWEHSSSSYRTKNGEYWGENMYYAYDQDTQSTEAAQGASDAWWAELAEYGVGPENNLTDAVYARGVGHYTQMAWETSYKLGCGVSHCNFNGNPVVFVVCQYGPGGNYMNRLIYTVGDPCTDDNGCPGDTTCSVSEGLCVVPQ